ncbi:MAG TPA: hypothetical protein VFA60_12770 [Terriglobales bacterium]|nr:hypothetical protein [Terriglobales bacterium]
MRSKGAGHINISFSSFGTADAQIFLTTATLTNRNGPVNGQTRENFFGVPTNIADISVFTIADQVQASSVDKTLQNIGFAIGQVAAHEIAAHIMGGGTIPEFDSLDLLKEGWDANKLLDDRVGIFPGDAKRLNGVCKKWHPKKPPNRLLPVGYFDLLRLFLIAGDDDGGMGDHTGWCPNCPVPPLRIRGK